MTRLRLLRFIAAAFCAILSLKAFGGEWFVSPGAGPSGEGTPDSPWALIPVLEGKMPVQPGDTVWLLEGIYSLRSGVTATLAGLPDRPIIVRARPGKRAQLEGALIVKGGHVWYWGFEIRGGDTTVTVFGPHTKLINLDIHGGGQGVGHWSQAEGSEIYGCIIHDFGYDGPTRGHGHAIYIQNARGRKLIADNVLFRGYGMNLHAYTQAGSLKGLHVEGNISFAAGTLKTGQVYDAYLVSGYTPADDIALVDNVGYHAGGKSDLGGGWRPIARVENYKNLLNGNCVMKGNYLAGARGLTIGKWQQATVTGNTIWSDQVLASVRPPGADLFSNYRWDENVYIVTRQKPSFAVVRESGNTENVSEHMDFQTWRARTGFDARGKIVRQDGPRPSGTVVFVRPNRYEKKRAHIAVFNWDERQTLDIDLSKVLAPGDEFRVHNVQVGIHERPVASGTYTGGTVAIPSLRSEISPHFEAYLVTGGES